MNFLSDVIKHNLCCLESGAFGSMTVGRVVCFVGHPRLKAMNRSLPCTWVQGIIMHARICMNGEWEQEGLLLLQVKD
jgi:hypothetical protein